MDTSVCVPNQSENGKYNLISGSFNKISLCVQKQITTRLRFTATLRRTNNREASTSRYDGGLLWNPHPLPYFETHLTNFHFRTDLRLVMFVCTCSALLEGTIYPVRVYSCRIILSENITGFEGRSLHCSDTLLKYLLLNPLMAIGNNSYQFSHLLSERLRLSA